MSDHEWRMTRYGPDCDCPECEDGDPGNDDWIARAYESGLQNAERYTPRIERP